ncbi:2-polyprenyl-6-methoxyphenol hydroxylase-like FAD-dependent oxidoreductase [Motilibacter peucedani]|uniref:2-polyprenyl-6-methoxyphenol hydroxylase-like FAD-dependent oxidoreductase n=1 Tax=Motilibacter peucedani TaxID=598650 RepID=A0A420XSV9_9ACTN|nr:NAD(P)/FAD-dependent oxidoreductase [Motilibacter peucedani]RKS79913.1 2-polyprenyl-6-methoxyphenol hydroxylase-like FAD-dependent oxidoreductase [Motilibacter peucedani]
MRVVIIGAGLGGLCLAHGLHGAGFEVAVYERDTRAGAAPASYGIHLNADGLRALHACLPDRAWQHITARAIPARHVVNFHDPSNGLLATLDFRTPENATDPITSRRAVTRGDLRDALLLGTRDAAADGATAQDLRGKLPIHWGKTFSSYSQDTDGRVVVAFADGTTTTCDLLVGADGSNSRVRGQRLPALARRDLGILNVAGRVPLTSELQATLPPQLCDTSINNIVPAGQGWMFASTWATGHAIAPLGADGNRAAGRYLVWAWAARRDTYPSSGDDLTGEQLKKHVQQEIRDWASPFRDLVAATEPADIGPVPLRTMPPLEEWEPDNVTLLGDAIHNMTPMGGIGANTALRDADTLRTLLLEHRGTLTRASGDRRAQVTAAVGDYEKRMRPYANAALALSTKNAERATNPAPLPRSIFRTLLRAAARFPLLQRRIFHTPHLTVPAPRTRLGA